MLKTNTDNVKHIYSSFVYITELKNENFNTTGLTYR
jgi:hypothetical protein